MDSSDINQDPLTNDSGATSFAPGLDMSAINEAVAAGGEADMPVADTTNLQAQPIAADNNLAGAASTEAAPAPEVAGFVDGDLTNEPVESTAEPVAEPAPVADMTADFGTISEPTAEPVVEPAPAVDTIETAPVAEAAPAETPTIADLANAAADNPADQTVTAAPAAMPPADVQPAQATPAADASVGQKSKTPTYVLIGLAIIAVVSVVIAVIVSQN
ncbi:hypothetical protein IKF25_01360 [Candidatus Saccharibacteria bacterium]|nr:hypothetical protein [Candidatus Saccharibacteria bacterium]